MGQLVDSDKMSTESTLTEYRTQLEEMVAARSAELLAINKRLYKEIEDRRRAEEALQAIAQEAIDRKAGARGLRTILEDRLLDIMYELPCLENVKECVIDKDVILKKGKPFLIYESVKQLA